MTRQLKQGTGWRLGWDPEAMKFQGLVGGADWAVELTGPEFTEFCRFAQQLAETMAQMQSELMEEEAITCEATSDRLWMEMRGYPQSYSLSFILLGGRRAEGSWNSGATAEVVRAVSMLEVF